ncbi:MAG: hypothetical protein Q8Q09_02780 [Deltaproteobacteria bacterium]|nr:hypothetical protein [Deltaproteobacteria bacterium]
MSMRAIDEPIPDDERLFRTVTLDDVLGDFLRETSVDLQGMSMFRQKYCATAAEALKRSQARGRTDSGVVVVSPACLPPPITLSNGSECEAIALDAPSLTEDNAHAEVRTRRTSDRPNQEAWRPKSPAAKLELKHWLARKMRVEIVPT